MKNENKLRKQICSNPSKGEATKNEKIKFRLNFFSRKWFDASDFSGNCHRLAIIIIQIR